jgi:NADH:ubiquinone oxidoreductase subunit 5 (subunit L)/multisubunit Na+/H+ antiporter MnhA subunit
MILLGTFTAASPLDQIVNVPGLGGIRMAQVLTVLGATGVILAAVYLLWMVQKVLFGPLQDPANERIADLSVREIAVMLPLAALMIVLGLFPGIFLKGIEPSVQRLVTTVHQKAGQTYQADAGAKRLNWLPAGPGARPALQRPLRIDPNRLRLAPGRFDALRPEDIRRPPTP